MELKDYIKGLQKKKRELNDLFRRKLPVHTGRIAKDHYQENFRQGGFVNGGLKKWEPAKRLSSGGSSAGSNYKTLLSSRNHLFSSIKYIPGDSRVKVCNDAPHASAHNNGETIEIPVTPKMRKFAWAKFYEVSGTGRNAGSGGKKKEKKQTEEEVEAKNQEASFWKGLALTKKEKIKNKMPQRQFLGESQELTQKIKEKTDTEVRKILNS